MILGHYKLIGINSRLKRVEFIPFLKRATYENKKILKMMLWIRADPDYKHRHIKTA